MQPLQLDFNPRISGIEKAIGRIVTFALTRINDIGRSDKEGRSRSIGLMHGR